MFMQQVADAYAHAPDFHLPDVAAWRELAKETRRLAEPLYSCFRVQFTPHDEPYATAADMLRDIAQGRIVVSTVNSDHPVWSLTENCEFRLVHGVLGHGVTGAGFDWPGEWRAYEKHASLLRSPLARHALFTEAVGQVAYKLDRGAFTTQKVILLPQWMQYPLTAPADDATAAA